MTIPYLQRSLSESPKLQRSLLRACSHESWTVNYPGASVTSCSHDDLLSRGSELHCPGASSSKSDHDEFYLNSFSFYRNCYREWFQTRLPISCAFWNFFIGKFILNINNEHAQDYSCPGATFSFCSQGENAFCSPGVVQRVTRLSKLPRGNEKLMWTVTGVRPCTEAKLTPGSLSCPGAMSCPGIMWTGPKSFQFSLVTTLSRFWVSQGKEGLCAKQKSSRIS